MPARLATVLTELGFDTPTPIQQATLPDAFAGRDLLGRGRTGSGKTLAFLLPLVGRLSGGNRTRPRSGAPRAMILAPTRELVAQIDAALQPLAKAAGLTSRTVFGGVGQGAQVAAIRRGTDILVACPGRLEDLIEQGHCSLSDVEISVLDEADHMADLGFLPAVRRLLAGTPAGGQRMLFSATLDRAVDALVRQFLVDPRVHQADSAQSPVSTMTHHVLQVTRDNRLPILIDLTSAPGRTVVFTRTKHGAKGLARKLNRSGVPAVELHGNLNQNARTRNLEAFHSGRATTLVATDIAARGIHVDHVALVIHADPPVDPKAYLHRSGRTARAGNSGAVITLATPDQTQEVRQLTRSAGITPTTTKITSDRHAVLTELAPGPRVLSKPVEFEAPAENQPAARSADERQRGGRPANGGGGRRRGAGRGRGRGTGNSGGNGNSNGNSSRNSNGNGTAATAERATKTASRSSSGGRNRRRRPSTASSSPASSSPAASSPAASPTHSAAAFSARRR
ncbi:DEAD/DEAH box helicase [Microlunatus sp. GCM10028923]|uniref:DEAD/DEAH box helicase n=1 Tax=Microlunatus sp. GCM10028923 TaxID=3273400 RepID=UPI00361C6448